MTMDIYYSAKIGLKGILASPNGNSQKAHRKIAYAQRRVQRFLDKKGMKIAAKPEGDSCIRHYYTLNEIVVELYTYSPEDPQKVGQMDLSLRSDTKPVKGLAKKVLELSSILELKEEKK